MGGHLRVDLDALDRSARDLATLRREFESATTIGDDLRDAVGSSKIRDAVGTFTDNWRRHREGMVSLLEATAEMARNCHDGYTETDAELAKALTEG